MSGFSKRLLKRSIVVAVVLGVMGYVLAEVFLIFSRMNGGVVDGANDSVRWRTPLTMAGIGVVLQIVVETIAFAIRRKKPAPAANTSLASEHSARQSDSPAV